MRKTYIFGHRKPDTDSVMSAIALSYLKNVLGEYTEARILSNVNKESKYALEYFNIKTPKYLNDVKLQLRDVHYHKNFFIEEDKSIYDAYQEMLRGELTGIPICKKNGRFLGFITLKDLSYNLINENILDLYTSYDNLLYVLKFALFRCMFLLLSINAHSQVTSSFIFYWSIIAFINPRFERKSSCSIKVVSMLQA